MEVVVNIEITSVEQGIQLKEQYMQIMNEKADAVQTKEKEIKDKKSDIAEKEKDPKNKEIILEVAQTELAQVEKLYKSKKSTVSAANKAYKAANKALEKAKVLLESYEREIGVLTIELSEATNNRNIVEQAYIEYQRKNIDKYNRLYDSLVGLITSYSLFTDFSKYYDGNQLNTAEAKVSYMQKFLSNIDNFERVWGNDTRRVMNIYRSLKEEQNQPISDEEVKSDIENMILIKRKYSTIPSVSVDNTANDSVFTGKFNEDSLKKTTTNFGKYRGSRKKSAIDLGKKVYLASVVSGSLKKLEKKGGDSVINKISLYNFLGKGEVTEYRDNTRVVKSLNLLPVQAMTFKNKDGVADFVFAGDENDGCLAYRTLDKSTPITYKQKCVEANNTQLVAMIYVALIESEPRFKRYANEYFTNKFAYELKQFGEDKGLLFVRDEPYADSPLDYYPLLGECAEGYIYTGAHNGFDKIDKRDYCVDMITGFVDYCAEKLKWKPATLNKFLRGITFWGWYDNKELSEPLVLI